MLPLLGIDYDFTILDDGIDYSSIPDWAESKNK